MSTWMPVLVKRCRSVVICVNSFSAGESGNFTEFAPEALKSNALHSRKIQAAISKQCNAGIAAAAMTGR